MAVTRFNTFEEWIDAYERYGGKMVSPGWIVNQFGVSRSRVSNWIHRDGLLDAYIYEGEEGQYIVIPMDQAERIVRDRVKKK